MNLIQKVLDYCGYVGEPTKENLIICFLDYIDSGAFANLSVEEAKEEIESGEITIEQIAKNLLRIK